jgi:hypothetical protein
MRTPRPIAWPASLAIVLGAGAFPAAAQAADPDGLYAIWGLGQTSCHQYNQAREKDAQGDYKVYLMGYLTAYNTFSPDTYSLSADKPLPEILAWLDKYCTAHQVDGFDRAARQLVESLRAQRQVKSPARAPKWGRL